MEQAKTRSIKFNFVMNLILTTSSIIFPLITAPYINRVLQAENVGRLAFVATVLTYFSMFASLGIPTYGIRVCAQVRDDKQALTKAVHELLIINLISSAATYAAFFLSLALIPTFRQEKELLLISSMSLLLNTIGVNWFYSALEKYSYITVRSLIFKIISICLMFLLVRQQNDYFIYAAITVIAAGGSNILNFFYLRKFIPMKPIGNYQFKKHFKPVFLFFGAAVASGIYTNLDTVMLRFMTDNIQVGYYSVGVKLKSMLTALVTSLGAVLLPRLSYYVQEGRKEEFRKIIIKAFNFIFLFASSLVLYFMLFAKEAVWVLSDFDGAIMPLRLILPSILFIGLSYVTGLQILIPMGQEKKMMISYIAASIVNFCTNLFILPAWKASGAAFSASFAEFTVLFIQCFFILPLLKEVLKGISFWKIILALVFAAGLSCVAKWLIYYFMDITDIRGWSNLFILIITAIIFWGIDFLCLLLLKERFILENVLPIIKKFLHKILQRSFAGGKG